jgi:hypothetical protein
VHTLPRWSRQEAQIAASGSESHSWGPGTCHRYRCERHGRLLLNKKLFVVSTILHLSSPCPPVPLSVFLPLFRLFSPLFCLLSNSDRALSFVAWERAERSGDRVPAVLFQSRSKSTIASSINGDNAPSNCAFAVLHMLLAMSNYEMPNPHAWLTAASEEVMDLFISQRQPPNNDPFSWFMEVLRRSNPLIPPIITGPLSTLRMRVLAFWSAIPSDNVQFYDLKAELLAGFCSHLQALQFFDAGGDVDRLMLRGFRFYVRHPSRNPEESPFSHSKRDDRLEAMETVYFLTLILSTAENTPPPIHMVEGPLDYIPYYPSFPQLTSPKRRNAASLALAARFFRLDTRQRVFDFDLTAEDWVAWNPDEPQAADLEGNESGYRHIAQLSANKSTRHSAVSYFVLKLLTIRKEVRTHPVCLLHWVGLD